MIAEIEAGLISFIDECLDGVDVAAGPGEWDGGYIRKLLSVAPAVRVVWSGATMAQRATEATMEGAFSIYIPGGGARTRRPVGSAQPAAIPQSAYWFRR